MMLPDLSGPDFICLKDETLAKSALSSPLHWEYSTEMPDTWQVKQRDKFPYRKTVQRLSATTV